jgi:hypothetical protein
MNDVINVLRKAHVKHINYFILNVEGGELAVLKSTKWKRIKLDVLCIETNANNRPIRYAAEIISSLSERGYIHAAQQGRNTWYTNSKFVPSTRPGIDSQCYNGFRRSRTDVKVVYERC